MTDVQADDLQLVLGGATIGGWTEVRVSRSIERLPNSFQVGVTDLNPGDLSKVVVNPGDACEVRLDGDLVLTGYVNRAAPSYEGGGHAIRVTGRGRCQDLVDCSAELASGQVSNVTVLALCQQLAKPYGLTVTQISGDTTAIVPQFNPMIGETGYEIIERVCRWAALLAYEGPDGNLVLAQVSDATMASGVTEGVNLLAGVGEFSDDQCFSDYSAFLMAMDVLSDLGEGGNLLATAKDPNVKRNRKRYIIAEAAAGGLEIARKRAEWEAARRRGRATSINVTVDTWRDSAGRLWEPNTQLQAVLPGLWLPSQQLTIGAVDYVRDAEGTRAELTLMPPKAFLPEPILLQPTLPDLETPS